MPARSSWRPTISQVRPPATTQRSSDFARTSTTQVAATLVAASVVIAVTLVWILPERRFPTTKEFATSLGQALAAPEPHQ